MRTLYDCAVGVLYVFMYLSAVDELDGSLPEEEIDMVFEVDRPHKMRSCKEKAPALPNWRKSPTSHQISQRGAEMKKITILATHGVVAGLVWLARSAACLKFLAAQVHFIGLPSLARSPAYR